MTSEIDSKAREVYKANFDDVNHLFNEDISQFTEENAHEVPDHDLLLGGFPCQPFSHAGQRKGFEDTRGTLFFSIAAIVAAKRPKVLLLENVRGLRSHDAGHTLNRILDTLKHLGYEVHYSILNARDFGLAQNRNRLFIVAIRSDLEGAASFTFPAPTFARQDLRVKHFLDSNVDAKYTISDRLWVGHQNRKSRNRQNGKGFGYQMFDLESHYVATISARYYKDGSEVLIHQAGCNPRKITPNEARRFQGFPEGFKVHSSDSVAYKQFGNAVPVNVISAIAQSLRGYLTQASQ
jgi:DNA (cytosine-5)-methyltransferase 1